MHYHTCWYLLVLAGTCLYLLVLAGTCWYLLVLAGTYCQIFGCRTSEAKLNNFTRVEPILNLLGIPFDTNTARSVMTEKHGEATKLMYQLFIALNKKQKAGLTGTAMETMRPAAPAKLDYMKSLIYKEVYFTTLGSP